MIRRLLLLLAVLATAASLPASAQAERRVALVIGNARYVNAATLRNPANDASDMAETLKKLGFEVLLGLDLDQQAFATKVEQFAQSLDGADVGLFFYAGHGLQINDRNHLVSVNARLSSEFLISSETIALDDIVRVMESRAPVNLVFLDACRNNPLTENLKRNLAAMKRSATLGRGLARVDATSRDTLIAFAAAPGQEAADGSARNSPFTASLLRHIPQPGLEVSVMLKEVSADVRQETRNSQRPQQISDMSRTFYFNKPDQVAAGQPAASPPPAPEPAQRAPMRTMTEDDRTYDVAFWNAAQAANECDAVRAYLQKFPNGIFTSLAKLSERRLCKPEGAPAAGSQATPAVPPPAPAVPQLRANPSPPPVQPPPSLAAPTQAAPAPPQRQALRVAPPPDRRESAGTSGAFRDCAQCPEMLDLPAASFAMGSNEDRTEKPIRQVAVRAFALSRFPVTAAEWSQCVADKACSDAAKGEGDEPVHNVSWSDAQQYIAWLSGQTGQRYRLPSEAEWEYAARAQTTTRFWWGNAPIPGKANCKGCGEPYDPKKPVGVASFQANPFGLHAMTGGVSQWVADCWHKNYVGGPHNGGPWEEANCRERVLRGGSWMNDPSYMRSASRDHYDAGVRYISHGLRVARSPRQGGN